MDKFLDGITKALSVMAGESKSKEIDLSAYREAVAFYGDGENEVGVKLSILSYVKQLLNCAGRNMDDVLNADMIMSEFCSYDRFKHISEMVDLNYSTYELKAIVATLVQELRKYVSDDSLKYEAYQVNMWRVDLFDKIMGTALNYGAESLGEFLNIYCKSDFVGRLDEDTDVLDCTGYIWLGREIAKSYGYDLGKTYSTLFLRWCARNGVENIEAKHMQLYEEFKVDNDTDLDLQIMNELKFY